MVLRADISTGQIILDGTAMPGIFQSLAVNGEIIIDSGSSAGNNKPRKVMRGFADKTISLSMVLLPIEPEKTVQTDDGEILSEPKEEQGNAQTVYEQLATIEKLFKDLNSGVPKIFKIDHEHLTARGITQVVFKSLASSEDAASDKLEVSLQFEEFIKAAYDGSQ